VRVGGEAFGGGRSGCGSAENVEFADGLAAAAITAADLEVGEAAAGAQVLRDRLGMDLGFGEQEAPLHVLRLTQAGAELLFHLRAEAGEFADFPLVERHFEV